MSRLHAGTQAFPQTEVYGFKCAYSGETKMYKIETMYKAQTAPENKDELVILPSFHLVLQ